MPPKALRASGGQLVYSELRQQILSLEIAPGTRLYEPELSQRLRVSRTPLREAIKLLLAEDLLDQLPTGGVVVPPLSVRDIDELYTVRAALEGIQAADAARKATDAELRSLEQLLDRNALLVGFADDAMNAGHDIHQRIADIADNRRVTRMHHQVDGHMTRYRKLTNFSQTRRDKALEEHRDIVDALVRRDPEAASKAAGDHVLAAREEAVRALTERDFDASDSSA